MPQQRGYVNPMEWVGEAHNSGVRFALANIKFGKKKPSDAELAKLVTEYFSLAGIPRAPKVRMNTGADVWKISSRKRISLSAAAAKALAAVDEAAQSSTTLSGLLKKIKTLEIDVSRSVRGTDLAYVQSVIAVARHSATLWAPINQGGEGLLSLPTSSSSGGSTWFRTFVLDYKYYDFHGVEIATLASVKDAIDSHWFTTRPPDHTGSPRIPSKETSKGPRIGPIKG